MKISNEFTLGQSVFLKTDKDQLPRLVTGILIRPGSLLYYIVQAGNETQHYDFEMSTESDVLLSSTN